MIVPVLKCTQGYHKGRCITADYETLFGVDASKCQIFFPSGCEGISRVHMRLWRSGQILLAMDMGSTNGTYLNQNPMTPGLVYSLNAGDMIQIGRWETFIADYAEIS